MRCSPRRRHLADTRGQLAKTFAATLIVGQVLTSRPMNLTALGSGRRSLEPMTTLEGAMIIIGSAGILAAALAVWDNLRRRQR